jgi:hypothetical protein
VWRRTTATKGHGPIYLDIDATLIQIHSENKEGTGPNYKGGFGFYPLLCFADCTGEALSGLLRPGNAGSNTVSDHIVVLDDTLAQLPPEIAVGHRPGDDPSLAKRTVVIRADSAGCTGHVQTRGSEDPRLTRHRHLGSSSLDPSYYHSFVTRASTQLRFFSVLNQVFTACIERRFISRIFPESHSDTLIRSSEILVGNVVQDLVIGLGRMSWQDSSRPQMPGEHRIQLRSVEADLGEEK